MVRRRTLNILGEIGPAAVALLPAVREALNDSDTEVRQAAADALAQIQQRRELFAGRRLRFGGAVGTIPKRDQRMQVALRQERPAQTSLRLPASNRGSRLPEAQGPNPLKVTNLRRKLSQPLACLE